MIFIVSIIILAGTLNNIFPIYLGYQATPPEQTYLGTIHHPNDYFYYLSQFAQGEDSWGLSKDLYTHEYPNATIVGWVNVLMGKIGALLGFETVQTYHFWVVVLTTGLLICIYLLFRQSIPEKHKRNTVALVSIYLFVVSNTFSYPVRENGQLIWKQIDYWFNFGTPGQRLGGVPHHLLMHILMSLLFILLIQYYKKRFNRLRLVGITLCIGIMSSMLASIQPLHWVSIGIVSVVVALHQSVKSWKELNRVVHDIPRLFWPVFLIGSCGVLPALTLQRLFSAPPFSQLPQWEFVNSVMATPKIFVLGLGPVVFIAFAGIFLLRKKLLRLELFVLSSYVLISICLFFSPISTQLKLQNVRFLSTLTVAGLAVIAGYGLVVLTSHFGRLRFIILSVLLVGITLFTIPAHYARIVVAQKTGVGNAYIYVDNLVVEAMKEAKRISHPDDLFAVMWPYHISFPAMTGRRIYFGHPLLTINSVEKGTRNYHFFSNIVSVPEQEAFLTEHRIRFVVAEPWAMELIKAKNMHPVYKNTSLWIYEVDGIKK